jgi:hypothetical protein
MAYCRVTEGVAEYFTLGLLRRELGETEVTPEVMAQYGVYAVTESAVPDYDVKTERVKQEYELINGDWFLTWQVYPKPNVELIAGAVDKAKADRKAVEQGGVNWQGYIFDTSEESQARHNAAATAVSLGLRTGGVWKAKDQDGDTAFVDMSNDDLIAVTQLIYSHVQGCFEAEAMTVAAIQGGDITATFADYFAAY